MEIKNLIKEVVSDLFGVDNFLVERPMNEENGDWATNAAMILAKEKSASPRDLAFQMVEQIGSDKRFKGVVDKVEVAGPGFINFFINDKVLYEEMDSVLGAKDKYGSNRLRDGEKVMIEFTDPNPFKVFHIGHLMSNSIGESLSRLIEFSGATVVRACYQGDVGIHVAKAIWGIKETLSESGAVITDWEKLSLSEKADYLGKAYARGSKDYEESEEVKEKIEDLNKVIYQRADEEINLIYDLGRRWSLDYFETIYKTLGTRFNEYFYESETGQRGVELVDEYLKKGVFEESQGAVIFPGEKYGLHTRVFINSKGLPTYEAKELGLCKTKYDIFPYDRSIIVTASEINDYFKVLLKALSLIYPDLAEKTQHVGHGMLKLKYGKMSSRTGNVVSGEGLIDDVSNEVRKKMSDSEKIKELENAEEVVLKVSVGAVKYSMLKQSPGKDILFDFESSLSFEGDSGPYLQYAYARAMNVWEKSGKTDLDPINTEEPLDTYEKKMASWISRFPEMVESASRNMSPNLICSYLIELSSRFNNFYANCKVVGSERENMRLMITLATAQIIKNGLWLLGIEVVERM